MNAKGQALAKQFEAKVHDATATIETLGDADWTKVTAAETWTVGVTAHHLAGALEPVAMMTKTLASGGSVPHFTEDMLHAMNAKHAKDFANCTKAETIELLKKAAATAAAVVRDLSDDQLAKSGTVFAGAPPMTAEQLVTRGLIGHIDEHFGSIRKTVGR